MPSCMAHLQSDPDSVDGVYPITNGGHSYKAYCDMTGGGWELVMSVQSKDSEFQFNSEYWTNDETYPPDDSSDPELMVDADRKFASFMFTPIEAIRGCLDGMTSSDCKVYEEMDTYKNMQDIFVSTRASSSL